MSWGRGFMSANPLARAVVLSHATPFLFSISTLQLAKSVKVLIQTSIFWICRSSEAERESYEGCNALRYSVE